MGDNFIPRLIVHKNRNLFAFIRFRFLTSFTFLAILILQIPKDSSSFNEVGGVKFGYKGKTYSVSSQLCKGGIVFRKPVKLDYICPNGFYLRRSQACSSKGEDLIGAEKNVCTNIGKDEPKVQALIPVTNADYPNSHTLAMYDDPNYLSNFRRFTVQKAVQKLYLEDEEDKGSPYLIFSNPRHTPEMEIGKFCYKGMQKGGAIGRAYQLRLSRRQKIQLNSTHFGDQYQGFFKKGCGQRTIPLVVERGKSYKEITGVADNKRFARAIEAQLKPLDEVDAIDIFEEEKGESLLRAKKSTPEKKNVQQLFVDLQEDDDDEEGNDMMTTDFTTEFADTEFTTENSDGDGLTTENFDGDGLTTENSDGDGQTTENSDGQTTENSDIATTDSSDSFTTENLNDLTTENLNDLTTENLDLFTTENSDGLSEATELAQTETSDISSTENGDALLTTENSNGLEPTTENLLEQTTKNSNGDDGQSSKSTPASDGSGQSTETTPTAEVPQTTELSDGFGQTTEFSEQSTTNILEADDPLENDEIDGGNGEKTGNGQSSTVDPLALSGEDSKEGVINWPTHDPDSSEEDDGKEINWPSSEENGDGRYPNWPDDDALKPKKEGEDGGVLPKISDLKPEVRINPNKVGVSNYIEEIIFMARQMVKYGYGEVDASGKEIPGIAPFTKSKSLNTQWYKMLNASVDAFSALLPQRTISPQMFQEALRVFSFIGRLVNLPRKEKRGLFPDVEMADFIVKTIKSCASSKIMKIPKFGYLDKKCVQPPMLWNISHSGQRWESKNLTFEENSAFEIPDVNAFDQSLFKGRGFSPRSHLIIEMLSTVFDIVYTYCLKDFAALNQLNAYAEYAWYMSTVFKSDDIFRRWTEVEKVDDTVYLSLLPSWHGQSKFAHVTLELDELRYTIKSRSVHSAVIDFKEGGGKTVPDELKPRARSSNCPCGIDHVLMKCKRCNRPRFDNGGEGEDKGRETFHDPTKPKPLISLVDPSEIKEVVKTLPQYQHEALLPPGDTSGESVRNWNQKMMNWQQRKSKPITLEGVAEEDETEGSEALVNSKDTNGEAEEHSNEDNNKALNWPKVKGPKLTNVEKAEKAQVGRKGGDFKSLNVEDKMRGSYERDLQAFLLRRQRQGRRIGSVTSLVKKEFNRKRRSTEGNFAIKQREIWEGLAYCLDVVTIENERGQTRQAGLEPGLERFEEEGFCSI